MKKMTLLIGSLLAVTLLACEKTGTETKKEDNLYQNAPSTPVPAALAEGLWFYGTLSAISYFDRDGHKLGNDYEAGREYQFSNVNGQGRLKFYQYLGSRTSSSCVSEYFTYKEGTVVFNGDTFTFYPLKGNFKTIKTGCSSANGKTERKAEGDDLKPVTYRYALETFDGHMYLNTFLEEDVNHEEVLFSYRFAE